MHRGLILVVAALALLATARGTDHLMFDNTTMANVTREGCDETNLCLEEPDNCDPVNNTGCLFVSLNASSIMSPDGFNLSVALSGNSSGLIGFGLSQNLTTNDTQLFVCGMLSNSTFFFQTLLRSPDGTLTPNERNTTQIRNSLNGTLIQCEFIIPNVNTTMNGEMMDGITSFVVLGNGEVNMTTNLTGSFMPILNSSRVNLTNAEGNITIPVPVPPRVLNISREGCGITNLCLETPNDCNPLTAPMCQFVAFNVSSSDTNEFNMTVRLSVYSMGYGAIGLASNATQGTSQIFACGNDSNTGMFFVRTFIGNNTDGSLTANNRTIMDPIVEVVNRSIECQFTIINLNEVQTRETNGTIADVLLANGTLTGSLLGPLTVLLTEQVNLTNAEGNITIPVPVLNINRDGCGNSKLCVESPNDCNPMNDTGCLFTSLKTTTNTTAGTFDIRVELAGESDGYVALGLTANASEGVTNLFICGINSSDNSPIIRRLDRNNTDNSLIEVDEVLANTNIVVNGMSIRCIFTIVGINSTASRQAVTGTQNAILLGNGTINGSVIGNFNTIESTGPLNITNPSANIVNNEAVELLLNISREGCGSTNLCLETPDDCDPLTAPMCQFVALNVSSSDTNEFNMTVRLSVYSMGYGAIGLATNASQGTSQIFACGNDSNTGMVFVRTFIRNNTDLSLTANNRTIMDPIVEVVNRSIECQFTIINLNEVQTRETNGTIADVLLANGTLTGSSLDPLNVILTEQVNLTSPTGTISNGDGGTGDGDAMNGARAQRSSDALLALLSLVTLLAMLRG
ncbi:uncharacterized protein [Syngnathus scovelli]|uniref:uncharacterized protein n=1 Tax=Syngnathus scovelli TaxID=161590 RepID=UPI00211076DC|nr:uncharacterized protein LOC125985143 [Syngnathus scovelli]